MYIPRRLTAGLNQVGQGSHDIAAVCYRLKYVGLNKVLVQCNYGGDYPVYRDLNSFRLG